MATNMGKSKIGLLGAIRIDGVVSDMDERYKIAGLKSQSYRTLVLSLELGR
jgi:hypothetical protein